jgi:hypothetical protein
MLAAVNGYARSNLDGRFKGSKGRALGAAYRDEEDIIRS